MSSLIHFAIPSKGRAGQKLKTVLMFPGATIYVPQNEVEDYRRYYKNIVVGVPNEVKGITATRNWILKNCGQYYVMMFDDDCKVAGYVKLNTDNVRYETIYDESTWLDEMFKLACLTEDLGYRIWGVSTTSAAQGYYGYKPFLFQSYVLGSALGIINDGSYYFDESFKVKEDYELCLRHVAELGGIVCSRYIHFECEHWVTDGGCKDYRTHSIETDCINRLISKYPNLIRKVKRVSNTYAIELDF